MKHSCVAVLLLASTAAPIQIAAQIRPGQPLVEENVCEGERCHERFVATATGPLAVYRTRGSRADRVLTMASGDTFEVVRVDIVHSRVGALLVTKSTGFPGSDGDVSDSAFAGDTLALLGYSGEGYYRVGHLTHQHAVYASWEDSTYGSPGDRFVRLLDRGRKVTWYRVARRGRVLGWVDDQRRFRPTVD